jgi:hypothetical protein
LNRLAAAIRKVETKASLGVSRAELATCNGQIGPLLTALSDLNSRLDVGLNFGSYGTGVGNARVAYDQIDASGLDSGCALAGASAEKALNDYIDAYNTWNNCVNEAGCNDDSIKPSLQKDWARASAALSDAKEKREEIGATGLNALAVPAQLTIQATLLSLSNRTIPRTPQAVGSGIYGAARDVLCRHAPSRRQRACRDLRSVLTGGVSHSETDHLDHALDELTVAL